MLRYLIAGGAIAAAAAAVAWWVTGQKPPSVTSFRQPAAVDLARGEALYGEYCSSCHGADLQGQPDWRTAGADGRLPAPPHDETGHTWHHPDRVLFDYTALGGKEALAKDGIEFDSGMPGFGEALDDQDIWNIIAFIKSTWPERQRNVQAERTAADLAGS
ncbi:c-type cytochrome [Tranquillimonas alkanivorans]|uniref:Cytochrome C oxidase, cbb3-type, subunit III n=1 Tax=Tranquillimonas alkanivorans TaxID=441119 RepID=A0A1I5V496_9RHOB|nr:cytochrome c [Tranquillimonas alkanivorans]SFQ02318.1 Cytochrome C oxidase, cbb3-type, subunit III [Tranquillimonas alkanivorans]